MLTPSINLNLNLNARRHEAMSLPTIRPTIRLATLLVAALLLVSAPAQAQVNVDIDITLQGVTILHYYSNLDVTIDSTALAQMLGYGATEVDEGTEALTISAYPFSGTIAAALTAPTNDPSAVDLTIVNCWAVRSITAAGTNTVTTAITDGTLSHSVQGAGTDILISNARVTDGIQAAAASVQFNSPGLINPEFGDCVLELDMSTATYTGEYQDGVFTLQASTP